MPYPNKGLFKKKPCRYCGEEFQPTAPSHLYCSSSCSDNGVIQRHYKKSYGLTYEEVKKLRAEQDHRCAICGEEGFLMNSRVKSSLNVDHDHKTGKVRSMLCHNCNRGLGLFQDDPQRLRKAAAYLEGATTIPKGSTPKRAEARDTRKSDDIVCPAQECAAAERRDESSELV